MLVDFLLQYRETDWELIKSAVSILGNSIIPECCFFENRSKKDPAAFYGRRKAGNTRNCAEYDCKFLKISFWKNQNSQDRVAEIFNVNNKVVILYIDEPIDLSDISNINLLNKVKEKGVIVVNGLEELKGVIQ